MEHFWDRSSEPPLVNENLRQMAKALAAAMEARDPNVRGHSENTARLVMGVGRELGLLEIDIGSLWLAGIVHDVGKIGIPGEILNKPGPLSKYELQIVRSHVEVSLTVLKDAAFPLEILSIVAQHHERLNGSGYPEQLKGNEIVFGAKILAVADVFTAMISFRPYRSAFSVEDALSHLSHQASILYDPLVVDAIFKVIKGAKLR